MYILLALGLIIVPNLSTLDSDYGTHQVLQYKRYDLGSIEPVLAKQLYCSEWLLEFGYKWRNLVFGLVSPRNC